jgi:large subunit ribosomal protein L21
MKMNNSYAIVSTGGKQYRVRTGMVINTELLHIEKGKQVELDKVLLISDGEELIIGNPAVEGAKVIATCVEEGKAHKIIVFRYKNKVRSRRKTGHRQPYTKLLITEIVKPGAKVTKKPAKAKAATGGDN